MLEVTSLQGASRVLGQLQERRAGGRELQTLGTATKLRAPNAVHANGMVGRLVLEDREQAGV